LADYHIHPEHGSDSNDAASRQSAWHSFAPLRDIELKPGDRVTVCAGGRFDTSLHLRGGGSADAPVVACLAPGRYDMHPGGMTRRRYHISNCNAEPDGDKAIALFFDHARHIRVEGDGATIMCRGKMIEACFDHSKDIKVNGLTFDYHRPTVSEWACVSATGDIAQIEVHPDSTYRLDDGHITWVGEGWEQDSGIAQTLDPQDGLLRRSKYTLGDMHLEEIEPHRLQVVGDHGMKPGLIYQHRSGHRDCCGVFMQRSKDITLDRVRLAFMHGMGVLAQFTENVTLSEVKIAPLPGSGRVGAAWADCTHFSGCRGKITIRDCTFDGAQDDAVNIHGTYLRIVDQPAPDQLKVRFVHHQTYGFQAFSPGDQIDFVRGDSLDIFGSARVKHVAILDEYEQLLTLDAPPPKWQENDVIENVTWTPDVEITGCDVRRLPTRGLLLTTRGRVAVSGCTFTRVWHGIHISSDTQSWMESGCVRDVTITGNRFVNCTKAAIAIHPENTTPNVGLHQNIHIAENLFDLDGDLPAVDARSTTGLAFVSNRITCDTRPREASEKVQTRDCAGVRVEGNLY